MAMTTVQAKKGIVEVSQLTKFNSDTCVTGSDINLKHFNNVYNMPA